MGGQSPGGERQWAADKRDFVADWRDDRASERDLAGDARDATADAREVALDQRERLLDLRPDGLGSVADAAAAVRRLSAPPAREQARVDRAQRGRERDTAAGARHEATARRVEATPVTLLASAFATIAEHLYAADSYDEVLQRIAQTAVSTVAGCEMASVTLREQGGHRTGATTAAGASAIDQAQYDAHEGPCLDAVDDPIVYAPAFPDARWPTLAARPVELGAQSVASYRLTGGVATEETGGSLNTYGVEADAFGDDAQQIGLVLAAHAATAARAVRERGALQDLAHNLDQALLARDVIGQAKGILMERLKIGPEEAFDALRMASNHLNEKLRSVASTVSRTGEFDAADPRSARRRPSTAANLPST